MIRTLVMLIVVTLTVPAVAFAKGGVKKKDGKALCDRTEELIEMRLRLPMPLSEGEPATTWSEVSEDFLKNGKPSKAMKKVIEDVSAADPADRWDVLTKAFDDVHVKFACDPLKEVLEMSVPDSQ